jgi:hypothetical protein
MPRSRALPLLAFIAALVALLAGCGGSSSSSAVDVSAGSTTSTSSASSTGSIAVTTAFAAAKSAADAPAGSASVRVSIVQNGQLLISAGLVNPSVFPRSGGNRQTDIVSNVPPGTWDVLVETLDPSGTVNAVNARSVTVVSGQVATDDATALQAVTGLVLTPSSAAVAVGGSTDLEAVATLADASTTSVTVSATFSSNNEAAATVSNAIGSQGQVRGVAAGTAMVSAAYAGRSASSTVTVSGTTPPPTPSPTPSPTTVNVTANTDLSTWTNRETGEQLYEVATDPSTGTTVVVGATGFIARVDANGALARIPTVPTTNSLLSVAWLGGTVKQFVAVGANQTILHSADGLTWTAASSNPLPSPANTLNRVIAYTNGTASGFLAVGKAFAGKGWILQSSDGDVWNDVSVAANNVDYLDVAYGSDFGTAPGVPMFEIVNSSQQGLYQQPAANAAPTAGGWAMVGGITHPGSTAVTFARSGTTGFFMLAGAGGWVDVNAAQTFTTSPGDMWSACSAPQINPGTPPNVSSLAYGNVAGKDTISFTGGAGEIYVDDSYSAVNSGHAYVQGSAQGGTPVRTYAQRFEAVRFLGAQFVAVGDGGAVAVSSDGKAYDVKHVSSLSPIVGMTVGSVGGTPLYVAIGARDPFAEVPDTALIENSTDGIHWTQVADSKVASKDLAAVCFGSGRFVAITNDGTVTTSTDGVTWALAPTPPTNHNYRAVTAGMLGSSVKFVAVGNGWVATSDDGLTWSESAAGQSFMNAVAYGRTGTVDTFVAVAQGGTTAWSTDLATWTNVAAAGTQDLLAVTFAGSQFVAVGANGRVETSPDGLTFTDQGSHGGTFRAVTYVSTPDGKGAFQAIVAVGTSGGLATSADGVTWTSRNSATGDSLQAVCVSTVEATALDPVTNVTTRTFTNTFVAGGSANTIITNP